jgi:hypothetical protein
MDNEFHCVCIVERHTLMNRRQFLISAVMAGGALSACGFPGGTSGGQGQDLARQFLTERNGGTPVAIGGAPDAPLVGFIQNVEGPRLTLKRLIEQTTITVQLAADAQIRKDVDMQLSELKAGDNVTAFGTRQGNLFQAELVQLGSGDVAFDSGPIMINRPAGAEAGGPVDGGGLPAGAEADKFIGSAPNGAPPTVTGTVEKIDGNSILLKDKSGVSTTVMLSGDAKIQRLDKVGPSELTVSAFVMAIGAQSGDLYQATEVRILPAPK